MDVFFSGPKEEDSPCSGSSVEATAKMSSMICDLEFGNIYLVTAKLLV